MDILKLTTSDAVRAALGVNSNDVSESYFNDSEMEKELKLHLLQWLPDYVTIKSAGVNPSSATEAQTLAYEHLEMYCKYYCADLLSRSAPIMLAQMESDGENEYQRYQENKLEKVVDSIHRKMATHRAYLVNYAVSNFSKDEETKTYTQFGKATPATDPVTGEDT